MLKKYGSQIAPLERNASSQRVALPLLVVSNLSLLFLSMASGFLPISMVILLAAFPGSILSLWQLQILHDVLHGSMFTKGRNVVWGVPKKDMQDRVLFWGSMPSVFGYYLYLKYGHLSHHKNVGDPTQANLQQLFDSHQADFEDGDVLFVAHRMKLKGDIGPRFRVWGRARELKMSISKSGFNSWRQGNATWNACMFASSFLFERFMLVANDVIVAITGRNYFFPNKPAAFHKACARYARCATLLRGALWATCGWKSLLFLFLSETLWSLPPHPACAMFVTNHGSSTTGGENESCIPTSSTYAGRWYSIFTLGTNYHCEHHDFPTIPLTQLHTLRKIAPDFYPTGSRDNLWAIMKKTFAHPDFYACMDAGILDKESQRVRYARTEMKETRQ
jgi:fatty acid desaturase